MDDMALLREFATRRSEAAFEALVARRVNFVYSAALRQVREPHLAEEITQAVFILLARKAGSIPDNTVLSGWLFKTTRYVALAEIRNAIRRQQKEEEAQMQFNQQGNNLDVFWEEISPLLDEALAHLGEKDRHALLLRFFENKTLAEVGQFLNTGEDGARKRVSRALEKLRHFFAKRGVASTTAIIAGAISANSVQAAPAALTQTATAAALAKGAAAGCSAFALAEGALKMMFRTKLRNAAAISGTAFIVVTTALWVGAETKPAVRQIDLAEHFDMAASDFALQKRYPWGDVPTGPQVLGNVPVNIGGILCLWGGLNASNKLVFRKSVQNIAVGQKFDALYLCHTAFYSSADDTPIARLILRYGDGSSVTNTIRFGTHVRSWFQKGDGPSPALLDPKSKMVWRGYNTHTKPGNTITLRFYITEMDNPKPGVPVKTIDLESTEDQTAECVLAMSTGSVELLKVK